MAGKFSSLNYADVDWSIFNNGSLFKPIGLRVITITDDCTRFSASTYHSVRFRTNEAVLCESANWFENAT